MNVIEVGDEVIWPHRTACALCKTVVDLEPYDIDNRHHEPTSPGWWKCPRCGASVPVNSLLATAARFESDRISSAVDKGDRQYSDEGGALPPVEVELGEQ